MPGFFPSSLPRIDFPFSIFTCKFVQCFSFKFIYFFLFCLSGIAIIYRLSSPYMKFFPSQFFYVSPFCLTEFLLPHMSASKLSLILTLVIFFLPLGKGSSPNFLLFLLLPSPLHTLLINSWFSLKKQEMLELSLK